jgi:hypothetical protein
VLAEAGTVVRSGQPRTGRSLLEEGGAWTRRFSLAAVRPKSTADRGLEATSAATDQVALEALGLLQLAGYPKIPRAETAPGWTTWERCRSKPAGPEAGRFLLQRSHAGTRINVRFRRSRRSTPSDHSDGLCSSRDALPSKLGGAVPNELGSQASGEARSAIVAEATSPPEGG